MNQRQKRIVRKIIRDYDKTYVEEGLRSHVDKYQEERRDQAYDLLELAQKLLGFRSMNGMRKAVGITKKQPTDW